MNNNLIVSAEYKENCEYKKSQTTKALPLINEPYPINISITSDTPTVEIGTDTFLTISCTYEDFPIKIGYVIVSDGEKESDKCYLDNNGQTIIQYVPKSIGNTELTIKYFDDNNFFYQPNNEETYTIEATAISTKTTLSAPETIAEFNEPVTLTVRVTTSNDEPVTYGRVTFLHYLHYHDNFDDRIEKVIGNPVFVDEDGYASITYVPMQSYNDDDLSDYLGEDFQDHYVEYVKAIFNYQNPKYNLDKWDYYASSNDMAYIFLRRENSIIIEGYNKNTGEPLNINDFNHYVDVTTNIELRASFIDENGQQITFNDDEVENKVLPLMITGTSVTPKNSLYTNTSNPPVYVNENYEFRPYTNTILANYIQKDIEENAEELETINKNYYFAANLSLQPGYYDIYAYNTENEYGDSEVTQYPNLTGGKKYLKFTEESMHYYLQVNYESIDTNNIEMYLEYNSYEVEINDSFNINVYIDGLSERDIDILENEDCYLYLSNQTLNAKLIVPEDDNEHSLIATFEDISFDTVGDYIIYAYTKGKLQNSIYFPSIYTNNIVVSVSGQMVPSIIHTIKNQYYPGEIEYTASISNIRTGEKTGRVYNYVDENYKGNPNEISFDMIVSTYTDKISNLEPNTYKLEFNTDVGNVTPLTYTILKSTIHQVLSDESTNSNLIGHPNQLISVILSTTGNNFTNISLDTNYYEVHIKQRDELEFNDTCEIVNIDRINEDKNLLVIFKLGKYTEDHWNVLVEYKNINDNYFANYNGDETMSFKTSLIEPSFRVEEDNDNNITISINNSIFEYIPLLIEMTDGEDSKKVVGVTNLSGKVTLTPRPNESINDWNSRNRIKISIDPTYADIVNNLQNEALTEPSSLIYNTEEDFEDVYFGEIAQNIEEETSFEYDIDIDTIDINTPNNTSITVSVNQINNNFTIKKRQRNEQNEYQYTTLLNVSLSEWANTYNIQSNMYDYEFSLNDINTYINNNFNTQNGLLELINQNSISNDDIIDFNFKGDNVFTGEEYNLIYDSTQGTITFAPHIKNTEKDESIEVFDVDINNTNDTIIAINTIDKDNDAFTVKIKEKPSENENEESDNEGNELTIPLDSWINYEYDEDNDMYTLYFTLEEFNSLINSEWDTVNGLIDLINNGVINNDHYIAFTTSNSFSYKEVSYDNVEGVLTFTDFTMENNEEIEDETTPLTQEETIYNGLREQLSNYENTYLFTTYKKTDNKTFYRG